MHELKIARNILKIVSDELMKRGISSPVKIIHFKAGRMHAIIPESLLFNFNTLKTESPAFQKAALCLEIVPLRIKCRQCQQIAELAKPIFHCTNCGGIDLEILNGQEMYVDNIELEDE